MNPPEIGRSQSEKEVKRKKSFERTKDPRFVTGGKPCARLRFVRPLLPTRPPPITQRCREQKHKYKCDHMTAQEPCSAVAMTLAVGGEEGAEAVVHEDPAVLRLRRAMPLPPAMGIA